MPQVLIWSIFSLLIIILGGINIFLLLQRNRLRQQTNQANKTMQASKRIYQIILENLDFETVVQKVADTIPNELQFGTGVVAILDEKKQVLRRIAASKTPEAEAAIKELSLPFDTIEIPLNDQNNLMSRAIREKKSFITDDVHNVFIPILTLEESKKIQNIMGTKTTLIYPIFLKDKPLGVFIASTKKPQSELTEYEYYLINDFINIVGLVMQNSQLFTSLKKATDDLQQVNKVVSHMNQKLQLVDKLKDDFVSIASHELRTPMTAIRSYAWMALYRSDVPLSNKLNRYLARTLISTERLINLVNDMLNVSRIESGRIEISPESFDLSNLMDEVMIEIDAKAREKKLHLQHSKTPIPAVFADGNKVHQVLLNLLGNALKFTPTDGVVSVSYHSDGQMVEVSVKDNGVGINQDDLSRLFKKFSRVDSTYVAASTTGGTGLGLFICKSLLSLMHGTISAYSEGLGKGSTFVFTLPVATPDRLREAEKYHYKPPEARLLEPVAIQAYPNEPA